MPIKLNRTSSDIERTYWNNSVSTYSGFYADQWITRTGTDQAWQEVVWGNSVFMAVSSDGATNRAMSSLDGINWTLRTPAVGQSYNSVAFGNSTFIAVSSLSTGGSTAYANYTTNNGINWSVPSTSLNVTGSITWNSITFSSSLNRFVAVGTSASNNNVMYSNNNGINWTLSTTPINNITYNSITWSSSLNLFVAVGSSNSIMRSSDGITWIASTSPVNNTWSSVTWSSKLGLFIAVPSVAGSGGSLQRLITSTDGITWVSRDISVLIPSIIWNSVTWSQELRIFIAIGTNSGTAGLNAMTSPDGINWYIRNTGTSTSHTFQTVTWSPDLGMFVALSSAGTSRIISTRPLGKSHLLESTYYI
jgi:hypothetical protein